MASSSIPPFVGAKIPPHFTFAERVYWYSVWIMDYPYTTIHFQFGNNSGFLSERHVWF